MLKKANLIKMNKRGLSEIVAYAIMIAIAISLAVAVFAWLKIVANPSAPIDCNEGTSIYLDSYSCSGAIITLIMKNNGGFNVSGYIIKVSDDASKEPTTMITPTGYHEFLSPSGLIPGASESADFTKTSSIKRISYQPFVFINNKKVVCQGTAIKEPITGC